VGVCEHFDESDPERVTQSEYCEECVKTGDSWVSLDVCKICGHVGCCDSSANRHARAHFHETGHSIIGPADPQGDHGDWLWCYEDNTYVDKTSGELLSRRP